MIIRFVKKRMLFLAVAILILPALALLAFCLFSRTDCAVAGGTMHTLSRTDTMMSATSDEDLQASSDRFQRPSKLPAYSNPYIYQDFSKEGAYVTPFTAPEDVILAYYGILENASNMLGYSGGCGTIGFAKDPYPYAYALFTEESQKIMSLDQFIASFEGIGHITLLQLYPAYAPPETPPGTMYFAVEIEVIEGKKMVLADRWGSYFTYYYGIMTVGIDQSRHDP